MLASIDRGLAWIGWLLAIFFWVLLFVGPELIGADKQVLPAAAPVSAATPAPAIDGGKVFAAAGCGSCHTFRAGGGTGVTGPDLDQLHPDAQTVASIVTNGGGGMPSFNGRLDQAQVAAVAQFVAANAR